MPTFNLYTMLESPTVLYQHVLVNTRKVYTTFLVFTRTVLEKYFKALLKFRFTQIVNLPLLKFIDSGLMQCKPDYLKNTNYRLYINASRYNKELFKVTLLYFKLLLL